MWELLVRSSRTSPAIEVNIWRTEWTGAAGGSAGYVCQCRRTDCNVAGSRKFLRLVKEKNYEEALTIARHQVSDGAMVVDVNMDDALLDAEVEMSHFLRLLASVPDAARVPVMIDTVEMVMSSSVASGCSPGKVGWRNSISLKEGADAFVSHAKDVKRFGAAVVVMCFDEEGQATTYERRIEISLSALITF